MPEPAPLLERARGRFAEVFGGPPEVLAWSPGRINLIGEHTDYTGGLAMPAAIDRYVVAALRGTDEGFRIRSEEMDDLLAFSFGDTGRDTGWRAAARGAVLVAREAAAMQGRPIRGGAEILVLADLPPGAGLSSSAAFELALLGGLGRLWDLPLDDMALVRRAVEVEHRFLGLQSGLLDQMACQLSRADHLLLLDLRELSHRLLPAALGPWRVVVADSGGRRALAGSAYGERVAACKAGLAALRQAGVATHLREARLEDVARVGAGQPWLPRLRHVLTENQRVLDMALALVRGDIDAMGLLLDQSHQSLRDDYAVSTPELDLLAATASTLPGCAGARMMGGGFGGCTIQLVHRDALQEFGVALSRAFRARFGRPAPVTALALVDGARVAEL